MPGPDLAATAVQAVGTVIADSVSAAGVDDVIVAGGGARNRTLVDVLRRRLPVPIRLSDELGVPVTVREALAMAVLGALCADGVPITLPRVTGCRAPAPVAGVWTIGATGSLARA